jgi:hypothetical protein
VVLLLVSCQPCCATASGTMALMVPLMLAHGPECGPEWCGPEWCEWCDWLRPELCCWLLLKLTALECGWGDSQEPLQAALHMQAVHDRHGQVAGCRSKAGVRIELKEATSL